jgi:hypothetical protein
MVAARKYPKSKKCNKVEMMDSLRAKDRFFFHVILVSSMSLSPSLSVDEPCISPEALVLASISGSGLMLHRVKCAIENRLSTKTVGRRRKIDDRTDASAESVTDFVSFFDDVSSLAVVALESFLKSETSVGKGKGMEGNVREKIPAGIHKINKETAYPSRLAEKSQSEGQSKSEGY